MQQGVHDLLPVRANRKRLAHPLVGELRAAGIPPDQIVLPGGMPQEIRGIRIDDGLRLIRGGADENVQPLGQQFGQQRRLLGDASVDVAIDVWAAAEGSRKRRVRLEGPARVLPVLDEYERSITHWADGAIRMLSQRRGRDVLEQMLGHDRHGPPGIDEVRMGPHPKPHGERVDHRYAVWPAVVVSPECSVGKSRLGIDRTLVCIRDVVCIGQFAVVPVDVVTNVKRDLGRVVRQLPRFG